MCGRNVSLLSRVTPSVLIVYGSATAVPVSPGFRSPLKWSGETNKSIRPDHNLPFEMITLKLKINTKHRLVLLNICNVDEYFQNTPADLRHIGLSSKAPLGPRTTDLKS